MSWSFCNFSGETGMQSIVYQNTLHGKLFSCVLSRISLAQSG